MAKRRTPPSKPTGSAPSTRGRLSPKDAERLEKALEIVRDIVENSLPEGSSFEDHEKAVLDITNELARRELERKLQAVADAHAPGLLIEHNDDWHGWRQVPAGEYRRHLPGTVTYHSLVGGLRIRRYTYRERARNGVTYVPLELEAGLMEHMTPALARATTFAFAQMPIREVDRLLRIVRLTPPSRSTLDRSARDLGAYAIACHDEVEPLVRAVEHVPDGARAIVLGVDRTAVRMRNHDPGYFHLHRDLRRPRPKYPRFASEAKGVSWRMDYVATVTFVDSRGERLVSRAYRVPAHAEPSHAAKRMMADVQHALAQRPSLKISIVQDGAPELWNLLREHLRTVVGDGAWHEVLDWYHVAERLTACAELCHADPELRARQCDAWKHALLETSDGATSLLRSLASNAARLDSEAADALRDQLAYFRRRRSQLCYRRARANGLPIGSGVTEGGCKSLIGARAKRSGQHWRQRGLSAALHWRTIIASDRFDSTWSRFSNRYRASALLPT